MKKVISLLILCSAIAYGTEETYPTVYSLPVEETTLVYLLPGAKPSLVTPTVLYLQSGSGGPRVAVAAKIDGSIFDYNVSMPQLIDDIKHCSPSHIKQIGITVRSEKDYDECKRALEERCGEGIGILAKMPKGKVLVYELLKLIGDPNNRQ